MSLLRLFLTIFHGQIKRHFIGFTKGLGYVSLKNPGSFNCNKPSLQSIGFRDEYFSQITEEVNSMVEICYLELYTTTTIVVSRCK